jgi:hypothetical protein
LQEENLPLSDDASPATAQQSTEGFSISSDKTSFVLGEPIVLRATLTNDTAERIRAIPIFDPTFGYARYTIVYPDGNRRPFAPPWHIDGIAEPVTLGPGESVSGDVPLFFAATGLTFVEPGEYIVVGHYMGLESPPFTVQVDAPTETDESAASELMLDDTVGLFLLAGGGESLSAARDRLEQVQSEYSGTLLAGYASYSLGVYYSRDARDFSTGQVRPADLDQAQFYFNEALEQPLLPFFRIRSYSGAIQVYVEAAEPDTAQMTLDQFAREFRDEPRAEYILEQAEQLIRER